MRREAELLGRMNHPNVLALLNAYYVPPPSPTSYSQFLIFTPSYPFTLSTLLSSPSFLPPSASHTLISLSILYQSLSALAYLHCLSPPIAHRDLSPSNFVFSHSGRLVLIDFGISISKGDEKEGEMYFEVGTGPYRAPELLFGARTYDPVKLDLWALGATMAEFFTRFGVEPGNSPSSSYSGGSGGEIDDDWESEFEGRNDREEEVPKESRRPLFDSKSGLSDFALIGSIFRTMGTPSQETWPEAVNLPDFSRVSYTSFAPTPLSSHLPNLPSPSAESILVLKILEGLLKVSAGDRMSAEDALKEFFEVEVVLPEGVEGGTVEGGKRLEAAIKEFFR